MRDIPARPVAVTVGDAVKFSLRTRDGDAAKVLRPPALATVEKRWQAVRAGPGTLSHKQLIALPGEVCRLVVSRFAENPGSPDNRAAFKAFNRAIEDGRISGAPPIDLDRLQDASGASALFGTNLRLPGSMRCLSRTIRSEF